MAVNGAAATSGTYTPNTSTATALYLGSNSMTVAPWMGSVYEALVYNGSLSTTEQHFIEGDLACKWGIQSSLPASHPYKLAARRQRVRA